MAYSRKAIAQAFRNAIPFLAMTYKEANAPHPGNGKTEYICHAIAAGGPKNPDPRYEFVAAFDTVEEAAINIVLSRLEDQSVFVCWLADKTGINIRDLEGKYFEQVQQHRKTWLERLAAEFSQKA